MKRLSDDPAVRLAECRGEVAPPAGDVEVLGYRDHVGNLYPTLESVELYGRGRSVRELVDRAHVTRLTAENARLQELHQGELAGAQAMLDTAYAERDGLLAEVEELRVAAKYSEEVDAIPKVQLEMVCYDTLRERDALQSELTKARELLSLTAGFSGPTMDELEQARAYLAHQSAPAAKREHILYRDGDSIGCIPESILDRNGQVALDMCTVCGKAESELSGPCESEPAAKEGE